MSIIINGEPSDVAPGHHIWTESRLPWFDTADTLSRHDRDRKG